MINRNTSVHQFISDAKYWLDRWVLIGLVLACVIALTSLMIDHNFMFLREFENPKKAVTLLLFTPILLSLAWICMALLPFSGHPVSVWIRILIYLSFFLMFNF